MMPARLVTSVVVILSGAGIGVLLLWAFLNTPESTAAMLAVSLVLVLAIYAVLAMTTAAALTLWGAGIAWRTVASLAPSGLPASLPALLLVLLCWWTIGRGLAWIDARSGEISAWFIATFNWSDVRPVLDAVRWTGEWIRWIGAPFLATTWMADLLLGRWRPPGAQGWLRRGTSPLRLALVTLIAVFTIRAPLSYGLYWMPRGLPPTWIEPAVAALKFGALAVIVATGLSLIARLAAAPAAPLGPGAIASAPDGILPDPSAPLPISPRSTSSPS